jgi:phospholipase/carboxylesterase
MPALSDAELVQFGDWTLRVRPAAPGPSRLLLMVHGLTGDENSMWVFANGLPADRWVVAPRGLHVAEPGGYSWSSDAAEEHAPPSARQLEASVAPLMQLVDEYCAANEIDGSTFDVIGFSQGAALGVMMSMLHPERIGKLGVLSGFVPSGAEELIASRRLQGKKIFVAHGSTDERVPIERARQSVGQLEEAGAEVIYCEAEVGHKVSAECLRALKAYLQS